MTQVRNPYRLRNRTLAVLLVLWLAVPALTPAQAQTSTNPLHVTAIGFDGNLPEWFEDDPTSTTVEIRVENTGSRPSLAYSLDFLWEFPDGTTMGLTGSQASSSTVGDPLPPGGSFLHRVRWTPQDEDEGHQVGEGILRVDLVETSTRTARLPVFIPHHQIGVSGDQKQATLGPDGSVVYDITLHNLGNVVEEISWSLSNVPARLQALFEEATILAEPGDTVVPLNIHYPFLGDRTNVANLQVTFKATSQSCPTPTTCLASTAKTGYIHLEHDLEAPPASARLDPPPGTVFMDRDTTMDVPFVLHNTGTQDDAYDVTSSIGETTWSASGPKTPAGDTADRVIVTAGNSKTLVVAVTAPDILRGTSTVTLTVLSDRGVAKTATATVKIHGTEPRLTNVALGTGPYYEGDPIQATVGIANDGDLKLEGATLQVQGHFQDGSTLTATKALAPLAGSRSRTETLDLGEAPDAGTVQLTATLTHAAGTLDRTGTGFVRLSSIQVTPPSALTGLAGETLRYHVPPHAFQVTNAGNAPEAVTLTSVGGTLVGQTRLELAPGETRTVPVSQTLPADPADRTRHPMSLQATIEGSTRTASGFVTSLLDDQAPPQVHWATLPGNGSVGRELQLRVAATDETAVLAAWVIVKNADETTRVDLLAGTHWNGLWLPDSEGEHTLTPHARDRFGNLGTGPDQTITVGPPPPPPPPGPPVLHPRIDPNTAVPTLIVDTDASEIRLRINGINQTHVVQDGTARIELDLAPGNHTIEVFAQRDGQETTETLQLHVPAEIEATPGLMSRLLPGPGVGVLVAAIAALALVRRRRH